MPALMVGLFLLLIFQVSFAPGGPIFFSAAGTCLSACADINQFGCRSCHRCLAQRSRFCTMGAFRDVILIKDFHLISGVASLLVFAFVMNLIFGQFKPGFEGQPIAHTNQVWNFLGMTLSGLAFALAGGCPGRQLFLSGEGDMDAGDLCSGNDCWRCRCP